MKLSITLPSIFPSLLRRTIDSIYQNTYGVDYEILVMPPFEVHGPFIKWIPEITSTGNCTAQASPSKSVHPRCLPPCLPES